MEKRWKIVSDGTAVGTKITYDGVLVQATHLSFSISAETHVAEVTVKLLGCDVDVELGPLEEKKS